MIPADLIPALGNHLWQSTLFAAAAGLLAISLKKNAAQVRHWVWLTASVKFLVPFSLLVAMGSHLVWSTALSVAQSTSYFAEQVGQPFTGPAAPLQTLREAMPTVSSAIPAFLFAVWACGFLGIACSWWVRWLRIRAAVRAGSRLRLDADVPVLSTPALLEPGVFGILRPVLLLPEGITGQLTRAQLQAILAHEVCHVRRRDNLAAAIHMLVEGIFWFHPLIWWIGKRLVEERERACDEEVLRLGNQPHVYAESILKTCQFYLESPLVCVSGVTGSDLKQRVMRIMGQRVIGKLTLGRKLLLTAAAFAGIALPVLTGMAGVPVVRAHTPARSEIFEAVSIKLAAPGQRGRSLITNPGRLRMVNVTLRDCILVAFGIQDFQLDARDLSSQRYEIVATAPDHASRVLDMRYEAMLQAMLADRFELKVHRESKVLPVYALEVVKDGSKLKKSSKTGASSRSTFGHVTFTGVSMSEWAAYLTSHIGRPVVDMTGLTGLYDFQLDWMPAETEATLEPPDPEKPPVSDPFGGPSVFTALKEQLGLKLTSKKLPVEIVVVDHAGKASTN